MNTAALDRWFAHPDALGLVLLLPALTVLTIWAARRRRWALARLGRLGALAALTQRRRSWAGLRRFVISLALSVLIVGIAGPQWGREPAAAVAHGRDLVVVLDLSRSMLADDVLPNRFTHSRDAAARLIASMQQRGGHRVALVAFAGRARIVCPLTHDYDHFLEKLEELDAEHLVPELRAGPESASGTRIGAALELAVAAHDARYRDARVQDIVLLSDGDDPANDNEWFAGIQAAQTAGIPVHTIGIGDALSERYVPAEGGEMKFQGKPVRTKLVEAPLKEIAEQTKGTWTLAGTGRVPLVELFRETIEPGRKREAADEALPVYRQRYGWFFAAALVLLLLEMATFRSAAARVTRDQASGGRQPPVGQ